MEVPDTCFVCGAEQAYILHEVDNTQENLQWQRQHMPASYWDPEKSRCLTVLLCQGCDAIKEGKSGADDEDEETQLALEESAMQEAMAASRAFASIGAGSSTDGAMQAGAASSTDIDIQRAMAMSLMEEAATDSEIERAIAASLAGDVAATDSEGV